MLSTILSYILFSALVIYLFVINGRLTRNNALLDKQVKDLQDLVSSVEHEPVQETTPAPEPAETEQAEKPITVDSIRTALRFNGISPEIPDTHEPGIVHFSIDDTKFRINAEHLPFMSIEVGYGLKNEPKEDTALMYQAAADVTSRMFIGKAYIMGDAEAIIFSVELLCDSYMHLRNNLKQYLDILSDINKRFYEAHEALKERRKEEREAVFSGNCYVQDSPAAHKVQS